MVKQTVGVIVQELAALAESLDDPSFEQMVQALLGANRVFVAGAGRAGAMMHCMAKRLMHVGLDVHVLGETVTPPAAPGDLVVIGSGSGETESLVVIGGKAKGLGVRVALITTNPGSTLGKLADQVVVIPATTPKSNSDSGMTSAQPMANLFEQMLLLAGDAICIQAAEARKMDAQSMFARHANLE